MFYRRIKQKKVFHLPRMKIYRIETSFGRYSIVGTTIKTASKYYEKFEDFLAECKCFFRCRTKYREELRTLLAENFHQYQN